jgi:hypothetical protein
MPSRVWFALAQLDSNVQLIQSQLDRLRAGLDVSDMQSLRGILTEACGHAALIDDLIRAERPQAEWSDRASLEGLVVELEQAARQTEIERRRDKLCSLADELEAGTVHHRFANRGAGLNALRLEAVSQLRMLASQTEQERELPGPDARHWLHWACNLDESHDAPVIAELRKDFGALDRFTAELEENYWIPAGPLMEQTALPANQAISTAEGDSEVLPTAMADAASNSHFNATSRRDAQSEGSADDRFGAKPAVETLPELEDADAPTFGPLTLAETSKSPWLVVAGVVVLVALLAGIYHFHRSTGAGNTVADAAGKAAPAASQDSQNQSPTSPPGIQSPPQDAQQPKTLDQRLSEAKAPDAAANVKAGAPLLHKQAVEGTQDNIGLSVEACGRTSAQGVECWGYLSNLRDKESKISLYRVNAVDGKGNSFDLNSGGKNGFSSHDFKVPARSRAKYSVKVPDTDPEARTLTLYLDVNNPASAEYTFRDVPITEYPLNDRLAER